MVLWLIRYHIPRAFIKPKNLLVVLEEEPSDPKDIEIVTVNRDTICSLIGQDYPGHVKYWDRKAGILQHAPGKSLQATALLNCPDYKKISKIEFASYGNPDGSCGALTMGTCNAPESKKVVEDVSKDVSTCKVFKSQCLSEHNQWIYFCFLFWAAMLGKDDMYSPTWPQTLLQGWWSLPWYQEETNDPSIVQLQVNILECWWDDSFGMHGLKMIWSPSYLIIWLKVHEQVELGSLWSSSLFFFVVINQYSGLFTQVCLSLFIIETMA